MKQKIEIEIDMPEGYEFVGYGKVSRNEFYIGGDGSVSRWRLDKSGVKYIIVQKKNSWKDNIIFPACIKKGWIARDECVRVCWYDDEPLPFIDTWVLPQGDIYLTSIQTMLDLSFLPKEFFSCYWEDSKVEVTHD